ncbi:hypothetical protein F4776DRAFT_352265 [Hypoxylon sp. NC0597]|nr:hypothetical protein F4776DRAFT_352265 [Hypoxylon sp. NC0597]
MHFLTVLTIATAALAVPFRHRRAIGPVSYPAFPTVTGTAPGTAPTGGSTAFPAAADPSPSYHASITYATTSSLAAEATAPASFATFPVRVPEESSALKYPTPSVSLPVDPPASFPTANFPQIATGTAPGTAPTGGSSGFLPFQPQTSSYSVSVSYARTAAQAVPTPY